MRRVAWFIACATLGCPSAPAPKRALVYPMTAAPPARRLEVVNKDEQHAITVSSGVAFGVMVSDSCEATQSTATLEIADGDVLKAHRLARGNSKREWVIVAVRPGKTMMAVKAECTTQTYEVTVVPQ